MCKYLGRRLVGKYSRATSGNKGQGSVRIRVDLKPFFPIYEQLFVLWNTRMSHFEARSYFYFWFMGARISVYCLDRMIAGHERVIVPPFVLGLLGKVHSVLLQKRGALCYISSTY